MQNALHIVSTIMNQALKNPHLVRRKSLTRPSLGFTLTEVLVTIGIISTLATVTAGLFRKGVEKAHASVCMGNIRSLSALMSGYAAEHQGFFPPAGNPRGYISRLCEDYYSDTFPGPDEQGALAKRKEFFKSGLGKSFSCPSRESYTELYQKTYLANGFIVGAIASEDPLTYVGSGTKAFVPKSISAIFDPSRALLLMECGHEEEKRRATLWAGNDVRYLADPSEHRNYDCHNGGRHYSFVDGHAEWRETDPADGGSRDQDIFYRGINPDQ